jgi:hypothetical protein
VSLGAMAGVVNGIAGLIGNANIYDMTPLVSESYQNGKKALAQYYVGQVWRFTGQTQGVFIGILVLVYFALPSAFNAIGMQYYLAGIPFFIPTLISNIISPYLGTYGCLLGGAQRANYIFWWNIIGTVLNSFGIIFWVVILQFPEKYGISSLIWLFPFAGLFPFGIISNIVGYVYSHKTIVKIRVPVWQTFIAPGLSTAVVILMGWLFYNNIYLVELPIIGFYPTFGLVVVFFIIMLMFVYYPLTAFFGGWDDQNLEAFRKASKLAGPSRILVIPLYHIVHFVCKHSPLHNKFKLDDTQAFKEAAELLAMKRANQLKVN